VGGALDGALTKTAVALASMLPSIFRWPAIRWCRGRGTPCAKWTSRRLLRPPSRGGDRGATNDPSDRIDLTPAYRCVLFCGVQH